MAKTKNKKRISADVLSTKKSITKTKKHNPFEVHTNKEKFTILGRQVKHDKGMPGVSRAKALKRRKDTLGQEYIHKNKTNKFTDKRIGEKYMTKEEAASARFVAERINQIQNKKESLFNLNDDEDFLTHKGQTLEELEQFQDRVSDDDVDDDEEIGKLDAEFTDKAHFGGDDTDGGIARKTAIDDLIADQKRRKIEISREKEEVSTMTNVLDSNWRSLLPLLGKFSKGEVEKPKQDSYDRLMRELTFEPRGEVSDRLKSAEELAKNEKERLEKLERERQERMAGISEEEKRAKHRSADDLDDGYFLQPVQDNNGVIAYDINEKAKNGDSEEESEEETVGLQNGDHKENGNDESDDDDDDDDEGDNNEEEDSSSAESEDNLSDLKDDSDKEEESAPKKTIKKSKVPNSIPSLTQEERKKMMDKAAAELQYTFELPDSYEELEQLLKNRNAEFQSVIIERMIKCNHPNIMKENKERMVTLFAYILQHINDTFESATPKNIQQCFAILDRLCPHLLGLSQINPNETLGCVREVIKEKQSDFKTGSKKNYPTLDTLVFLKLVSNLYSTSDYQHPIVTPCYIFISQLLGCQISGRKDIATGLFFVNLWLEYAQLSKRILPAAINFLVGVLFLSIQKRPIQVYRIVPPFEAAGDNNSLLALSESEINNKLVLKETHLKACDLVESNVTHSFKVRALNVALQLTQNALTLVTDTVGAQYFCEPILQQLDNINAELYPRFIIENITKCREQISIITAKKLTYIVPAAKKPKMLKMLEPKFDKVYDDKRSHKPGNKDKIVRDGMIRKIKSETRGAIREIRRDNAFLSKIKLKKQLQGDAERREKVNRIFSEASIQQGEFNAMDRKKKHM